MHQAKYILSIILIVLGITTHAQSSTNLTDKDISTTIFHKDSLFWVAYNRCDVEGMLTFISEDLEFYHDKGGITQGKEAFRQSLAKSLCGNPNFGLRREAEEGTVRVFPLRKGDTAYGAIISGDHFFHVQEKGKKEYRDGWAKFSQLWLLKNGEWKMSRILSYDHKPAPYLNQRKEISLQPADLNQFKGQYKGTKTGTSVVSVEKNNLIILSNNKRYTLYPETRQRFFVKDRDLTFEFAKASGTQPAKMIIRERDEVIEEALLLK